MLDVSLLMLGNCSYEYDENNTCKLTYRLQRIMFINPDERSKIEAIELCSMHYSDIKNDHKQRVNEFQMKINNLWVENGKRKEIAKKNDAYYNEFPMRKKIEDLQALLKRIKVGECKNYFCNADISNIDQFRKLYTAIGFKPQNKVDFVFYFCSLKCFNIFKGRCGQTTPIIQGQTTL